MIRKVDLVWGEVRRPVFVVRTETVLLFSLPAKVYPCTAVIQISRFWVRSNGLSEDGASATLQEPSLDETALAFPSLPPKKKDSRKDNMRINDFTTNKDSHFCQMVDVRFVLFRGIPYYLDNPLPFSILGNRQSYRPSATSLTSLSARLSSQSLNFANLAVILWSSLSISICFSVVLDSRRESSDWASWAFFSALFFSSVACRPAAAVGLPDP